VAKQKPERKSLKKRPRGSALAVIASILSLGLVLAVGALLLFSWIAEEVPEGDTLGFDNAVRGFVHDHSAAWLTPVMQGCSFLGSTIVLSIGSLAVLVMLYRTGHRHSAVLFAVTMLGATILNFVLKTSFVRTRPVPYFDTPLPTSYSFPSGHALFSLCFYGSLAWIWAAHPIGDRRRVAAWIATVLLVFLIGLSRVYLGVHYPSDVIAGYLAAFVWVSAVFGADTKFTRESGK
jgi:undecaprenyl-diphosphatase